MMNIGLIGLGKMGNALVFRLVNGGFKVVGYDPDLKARQHAAVYGAHVTDTLEHIAVQTRIIWLMIPAGELIDSVLQQLQPFLKPNDIIIDGGNSHYTDSVRRAKMLKKKKIHFIDCGTSGGLAGKLKGFSLMVGGDQKIFEKIEPILKALAAPKGYGYMGPSGSGHYVKMVHNGIEYALLQAYAEGFNLLKYGSYKDLDLEEISRVWSHGAVIRSWILDLAHTIFKHDQNFTDVGGGIQESGTGRWTVDEAYARKVPVVLIEDALEIREWSRATGGDYATKLVALLRHEFGGHAVTKSKKKRKKS
jgi:6-phosphogluconate dehydrogenase